VIRALPLAVLLSCNGGEDECYTRLYATETIAPSLDPAEVAGLEHMGATVTTGACASGVNFAVYSEHAERVELLLFDEDRSERPTQRFPMSRIGDVWNLYVEGIGPGQLYGYIAFGPNWPYDPDWFCGSREGFVADVDAEGNRFNPNKLLTDPYARALSRDHDWSLGSAGSGESRRQECTWDAAAKSVVVGTDAYAWSDAEATWRANREAPVFPGHNRNELILYEVHPKGFTANGVEGVEHPGTFRGIGEKASYFAELGVTAVELLPVHEKPLDGGYWGYNNINYFAPEQTYSADFREGGDPDAVIDEFRWMVDQLHQAGVEVVLDVVYNHTGEGGLWRDKVFYDDQLVDADAMLDAYNLDTTESATIYNLRGLDNRAWYALSEDNQGYWNNTGVGNELRANHAPMARLILDSLRYYVEEMHVDGFRFDLAGILGEKDLDYNSWDDPALTVLQEIADDPVLLQYHTRIVAEPWTAGGSYNAIGAFPPSQVDATGGWGEWNASFRDWWRSIANNDGWVMNSAENGIDGGGVITGSAARYAANGRKPYHSVNFATAHDGFTMYDLFSYDVKNNQCSPINPVCCDDPYSVWCDTDSGENNNRSRDWGQDAEDFKRQLMRDMFVGMAISQGTPMILGGDEWLRSQYGNNNAYSSGADNEWNWFRWGEWQAADERWRMKDFVSQILRYRLTRQDAFAPSEYDGGMPFAWKDENNADASAATWGGRRLMIHWFDDGAGPWGPEIVAILNFDRADVAYTLPPGAWGRIADTQAYFDADAYFPIEDLDPRASANIDLTGAEVVTGTYTAKGSSIVLLEAR
jgi:glycogen operon protein